MGHRIIDGPASATPNFITIDPCRVTKVKKFQLDPAERRSFLKTQLASFKVPKDFIILDEFPKGSMGKILKRELKKQVMDEFKKQTI